MEDSLYFQYWGKADRSTNDGSPSFHLLPYHCLDVAAIGYFLLDPKKSRCQILASQLGVEPQWLQDFFVFCLVLHDLGKFSRAFQGLQTDLSVDLVKANLRMPYTERHDTLGFLLWQKNLVVQFKDTAPVEYGFLRYVLPWLKIVFGHHGIPPKQSGERIGNFFEPEDTKAALGFICDVMNYFLEEFDPTPLQDKKLSRKLKMVSWQLAGVTVLADWLGSNRDHFEYCSSPMPLPDYWKTIAKKSARQAIQELPCNPGTSTFTTIKDLFSFIETLTPLQEYAVKEPLADSPQLFILEDVTGAGKTEAALVLTHRILSDELADGLYVALPTMATANAMYQRLGKVYRKFFKTSDIPSLILAHGARKLSKEFRQSVALSDSNTTDCNYTNNHLAGNQDLSATTFCSAWLADNRKKALLADVGVGTIDQALMAVLPARHQSLRLLGLSRKVLLVDEVHAYDPYMLKLLEVLVEFHAQQGGNVILLSATLPQTMREDLVAAFQRGFTCESVEINSQEYPLATHISATAGTEQHIDTRKEVKRSVEVRRLDSRDAVVEKIAKSVKQGKCVCWIRNTVREARKSYQELAAMDCLDEDKLHLFHSRFAMVDRQRIETDVLERFGKNSDNKSRAGQVLVATQVVEQSLDLDFDVMITDLAPVDLIVQRAGRLCRHVRDSNGNRIEMQGRKDQRGKPVLYILSPKVSKDVDENWLKKQQPGTQAVYPHVGQLWLTANKFFEACDQGQFTMPNDARSLIEDVYSYEAEEKIPEVLLDASMDALGRDMTYRSMANLNVLRMSKGYCRKSAGRSGGWDEENKIPTRLTETETVSVALAVFRDGKLTPYAENVYLPWAMSTLKIPEYEWENVQDDISKEMGNLVVDLKNKEKAVRWLEVFPIYNETAHFYNRSNGWKPQGENE